jgi:hypothetical protein
MQSESEFKANLVKIRSLQDGWLDGEGKTPTVELLDWFEGWFLDLAERYDLGGEYLSVFPEFEGGLELEWILPRLQPTLSIGPDYQTAWFHFIDPDSPDGYYEIDVDLTDPADREWIEKLREILILPTQPTQPAQKANK